MNLSAPVTDEPVISLEGVSKQYRLYSSSAHRARDLLLGRRSCRVQWALRGVDVAIRRGETVGVVGDNGAGKSTLLAIIAGASTATQGNVRVVGDVAALLELGAGFHPHWTGRQNAEFYLRIRGTRRDALTATVAEIESFADVGGYFDQPLRTYSSGMSVRLAFAAAVAVEPDILIVDEALAVGDAAFQHKCFRRIAELKAAGVTILLVTHRLDLIPQLCTRALLVHEGRLLFDGAPGGAVSRYAHMLVGAAEAAPGSGALANPYEYRMGNGEAEIVSVGAAGQGGSAVLRSGETASFTATIRFHAAVERPIFAFALKSVEDVALYGVTSEMLGTPLGPARAGEVRTVRIACPMHLPPGSLFADFSVYCALPGETRVLDSRISVLKVDLRGTPSALGLVDLGASLHVDTAAPREEAAE